MSAVLRAAGENFDVELYLRDCTLPSPSSYKRGEPRLKSKPDGEHRIKSGISFSASNADFDAFAQQISDSIQYLAEHRTEIVQLRNFPGVESAELDFGIWRRDVVVQCDCFPEVLVKLAGELGLGLALTLYPLETDRCYQMIDRA